MSSIGSDISTPDFSDADPVWEGLGGRYVDLTIHIVPVSSVCFMLSAKDISSHLPVSGHHAICFWSPCYLLAAMFLFHNGLLPPWNHKPK